MSGSSNSRASPEFANGCPASMPAIRQGTAVSHPIRAARTTGFGGCHRSQPGCAPCRREGNRRMRFGGLAHLSQAIDFAATTPAATPPDRSASEPSIPPVAHGVLRPIRSTGRLTFCGYSQLDPPAMPPGVGRRLPVGVCCARVPPETRLRLNRKLGACPGRLVQAACHAASPRSAIAACSPCTRSFSRAWAVTAWSAAC